MEKILSTLLVALYIFMAWRFTANSARVLREHFRRERRPYEIIPGTIVDFEMRRHGRPGSSRKLVVFYPVFEYQWKGKTHRKFHRRVMATFGPGLEPVPLTRMRAGDSVQIRIFPGKPSDARIEESFYFWKSRIWGHMLTVAAGCAMIVFGIYSAVQMLFAGA